ncbi:hypothetical protein ACP275_09G003300 [Erythranthe tilingii]
MSEKESESAACLYNLHILDQSGEGNHHGKYLIELSLIRRAPPAITLKQGQLAGYTHFMQRSSLESPADYLKDDCLKISCTVVVFTCHVKNLPLINPPKSNNIRADFGKLLLESKIGADVLFKVEDDKFWAHKCILASTSPVFRSQRLSELQQIVIPQMESRIFKAMLWFIYTGMLQEQGQEAINDPRWFMPESFMGKMLAAADRFELKRLKTLCESFFLERVSEESVAYLLYLAQLCNATELKSVCLRFAIENQDAVLQSNGCEYLKQTCPPLFLKLAGYEDNPSSGEEEEFDFCSKVQFDAKESLFGFLWPWCASHKKLKLKEA